MRLRLVTPVLACSILILSSCTTDESSGRMPVTTDSDLARELYETGMLAFDQVKLDLAYANMERAVKADPDFFMAHFWMYFMAGKSSRDVVDEAFQVEAALNGGEEAIRTAFKYLVDGQDEKVIEYLNKAIELYPKDPHIRKILYILQFQYLKDLNGAVESINKAVEAIPDYAMAYNQLGYALMDLEDFEGAEKAFDQYLRLAPEIANPYDSKGDYYMNTGQYQLAYESYMKAVEIDPEFRISKKKAEKARKLMETTEQS